MTSSRQDHLTALVEMIGQTVSVQIDRPLGSTHPDFSDLVYQLNYGFIPGTFAPDGEAIDGYVIDVKKKALSNVRGTVIAVVHRLDDIEDKLVVACSTVDCSDDEIREATYFQEQFFTSRIIRR
jgi:inorganic pyrophosphatase